MLETSPFWVFAQGDGSDPSPTTFFCGGGYYCQKNVRNTNNVIYMSGPRFRAPTI